MHSLYRKQTNLLIILLLNCRTIEDMIIPFYEVGTETSLTEGSVSLRALLRGVLERYYPKFFKEEMSETLPKFTQTSQLSEETVPWIWLSFILIERLYDEHDESDLSEVFGVALQVAKQDQEFISLEALNWSMRRKDAPNLYGFALKHFSNCPFLPVNVQILPTILERLPDSSKMSLCRQLLESPNMSLVETVAWILLENENFTALVTMLQPLIQSKEISANAFAAYLMGKLKSAQHFC